jgi:hypothetical protein
MTTLPETRAITTSDGSVWSVEAQEGRWRILDHQGAQVAAFADADLMAGHLACLLADHARLLQKTSRLRAQLELSMAREL